MSIKSSILNILNQNVGKTVSGGELAKTLGVSRNSVWKSINSLKEEGYDIASCSNTGYILNRKVDIFSADTVNGYLEKPRKILVYEKEHQNGNSIFKTVWPWVFPGCPVVRISCFHC